jgi:hypothetical protein
MLGKTPWVDRSLARLLPALAQVVPPEWLPRFDIATGRVEEYGCGHYGCVMPTSVEGLVCKVTTDISEAHFVARALTLEPPNGIVEYKKIFWAHGLTHRRRPMFVLWRSEAFSVGSWRYGQTRYPPRIVFGLERERLRPDPNYQYAYRVEGEADSLLRWFLHWASIARKYMHPHLRREPDESQRKQLLAAAWAAYERAEPAEKDMPRYAKGLDRVGIALRSALYVAQEMSGNPSLYRVGEALAYYLEEGLLLADVHGGNLGLDAEGEVLITDPGHVVEFHPRWATPPEVPALGA